MKNYKLYLIRELPQNNACEMFYTHCDLIDDLLILV